MKGCQDGSLDISAMQLLSDVKEAKGMGKKIKRQRHVVLIKITGKLPF